MTRGTRRLCLRFPVCRVTPRSNFPAATSAGLAGGAKGRKTLPRVALDAPDRAWACVCLRAFLPACPKVCGGTFPSIGVFAA